MIILNEREYAEHCLLTGEIGAKPYCTLKILAKYYYHVLGYRKKRISTNLMEFMWTNYPTYSQNKKSWNETIERIANSAKKERLYEDEGVWISKLELNRIAELESVDLQCVAFTMLCLAKLETNRTPVKNGWIKNSNKEIFTLAGVNTSVQNRLNILGMFKSKGLLEFPKKNGNLSNRVTFLDYEGENELFVQDFRSLGNIYRKYLGENYIQCAICGILIKGSKNGRKKYCSECHPDNTGRQKTIFCIDCGKKIEVRAKDNRTCRCPDCYKEYRKAQQIKTQKKRRLMSKQTGIKPFSSDL